MPGRTFERVWDDSDIVRDQEHTEFMSKLEEHHQSRNTMAFFTPEPGLGNRKLSLSKLYKRVIELGGYDHVSAVTSLWKNLATDYGIPEMSNSGYLLKNIYYKNLASYEIEDHWKKEAPPPAQLEELTAKGGDILQRADEWKVQKHKPQQISRPRSPTPPPKRTLRTAPTPRQFYQPEDSPRPGLTPQHSYASYSNVNMPVPQTALHFATATLAPSALVPQPVMTKSIESLYQDQYLHGRIGAGNLGAPFFHRVNLALKSGIVSEMRWASQSLSKFFAENEDTRLERLPNLTETMLNTVASIIADLKGIEGHSNWVLGNASKIELATSVAFIIRNLAFNEENAEYLSRLTSVKGVAEQAVKVYGVPELGELFHYCLDLTQMVADELSVQNEEDELYLALCKMLSTDDESLLIASLRILARLAINDDSNRLLQNIQHYQIDRCLSLLTSSDPFLLKASLEFLYQYSTYKHGTKDLLDRDDAGHVVELLKGLMLHESRPGTTKVPISSSLAPSSNAPVLSREIVTDLLHFLEPERAARWYVIPDSLSLLIARLLCAYEESLDEEVSQKSIWDNYEAQFRIFEPYGRPLLPPSGLIKVIPSVFPNTRASRVMSPDGDKYIVHGLRTRASPGSVRTQKIVPHKWIDVSNEADGESFLMAVPLPDGTEETELEKLRQTEVITNILRQPDTENSANADSVRDVIHVASQKTPVGANGEATGVALIATMILRNLAKSKKAKPLFARMEPAFVEIASLNPSLANNISELLVEIS